MGRDLERVFALLVVLRSVELLLGRGAPPALVAALAASAIAILIGRRVRASATAVADHVVRSAEPQLRICE